MGDAVPLNPKHGRHLKWHVQVAIVVRAAMLWRPLISCFAVQAAALWWDLLRSKTAHVLKQTSSTTVTRNSKSPEMLERT